MNDVLRLIVECGNSGICILNRLLKPVPRDELGRTLHPSQFGPYHVGRLTYDNFGVALYKVYR